MRVVVSCIPQAGHIGPLLPLAEAFVAQGDALVFASGPDAEAAVVQHGLEFRQVGPAFGQWYEDLRSRTRGLPGDGLPPSRVEHYFLPRLFGEIGAAAMIDGLIDVCRTVDAELLVFDSLVFAGPLAASVVGARGVQHTVGVLVHPDVTQLVTDAVSPLWREFDRDVPPAAGMYEGVTVAVCPPSLDPSAADRPGIIHMRPVPEPVSPANPISALPEGEAPAVYVTLGTFSNNVALFRDLVDALAPVSARFLFTVGRDVDPHHLGPLPANVRVEQFIPQAEVLPHCDAAIHHGGAGTTFGILAHGLPSVVLPQSADNFTIAERVRTAGAAEVLMPGRSEPREIQEALRIVLEDAGYRDAARSLANEIAAMPSPSEIAADLRTDPD